MKIKVFFIPIILLNLLPIYAAEWGIKRIHDQFYIFNTKKISLETKVTKQWGGSPLFTKIIEVPEYPRIKLLEYHSGDVGTKYLVSKYYAVIYDSTTDKFLGDFPYRYKTDSDSKIKIINPVWKFSQGKITISSHEDMLEKVINY